MLKEGARSQPVRATIGASAKHASHFQLEIDLLAIGVMELSSEQEFAIGRLCETQDSQSVSIPAYVRICLLIGPAPGHAGLQQHQANFAAQDRTTSAPPHRICPPMPAARPRLPSGAGPSWLGNMRARPHPRSDRATSRFLPALAPSAPLLPQSRAHA